MMYRTHAVRFYLAVNLIMKVIDHWLCVWPWLLLVTICRLTMDCECVVILSPSSILTPVCDGDQLLVTCSTTETFLRWNITLPQNGKSIINTYISTISSSSVTSLVLPILINSTRIELHRSSAKGELPLISTLTINSVSTTINRTLLTCMDLTSSAESTTTIVHIPGRNAYPNINITTFSERFESTGASVTLGLIGESAPLIMYNISIISQVPVEHNDSKRDIYQLSMRVPCYTVLNVSISASVMCGESSTSHIELYYVNCGRPQVQRKNSLIVTGYHDVRVSQGTEVAFSCSPGFILTGPNSSTCQNNGQWEPDPKEILCTGNRATGYNKSGSTNDRTIAIIIVPSVTGIVLMLASTLVVGIFCGWWFCRTNQDKGSSDSERATYHRPQQQIATESCPRALYEQVYCNIVKCHELEQDLNLTDNIAYVSTQEITKTHIK